MMKTFIRKSSESEGPNDWPCAVLARDPQREIHTHNKKAMEGRNENHVASPHNKKNIVEERRIRPKREKTATKE